MKQKIKLLLLLLSFSFILSTTSCQVEEDIINSEVPQQKLILKKLSKKEFENNKLIKEKLNSLKSSENLNGRIVYDSILNFYVNTDNIIFADNGTIQTYTFPITRIDRSFISENLIIQINGEEINTYIFDYQEDINNLKNLSQEQMQQKEILKYRILDSNISNNILLRDDYEPVEEMIICFDTFVWDLVEYHEGDLTGGPLYEYGWVYQGTHCDYASNQAGGGGSSSTGGGGFGTSGGGGSSSSTDNTIITVPSTISGVNNECISPRGDLDNNCVLDENETNFVTFLDGLTTQERQLIIGNNNTKMNVFNYLVDQNWSNESEQFVNELIDFSLNNQTYASNLFNNLNSENWSNESIQFTNYVIEVLEANPNANPLIGADCRSFEFAQPPGATKKGCAVTNFNHTFYTAGIFPNGSPYFGEIDSTVPIAYFTMPTWMTNGRAANLTAKAVTFAIKATDLYYAANPTVSEVVLGQYFSNRLSHFLNAVGGTVSTSTPPFSIPSPAPYITSLIGVSNPYNCE